MKSIKLLIITAKFNSVITDELLEGALEQAKKQCCEVEIKYVPGAVELPLAAQIAARSKKYNAVIVFGAVIYGKTDHYYYVCDIVSQGCMRVMLDESFPIVFGVLTVKTIEQALERVGANNSKTHMGKEAVLSAIDLVDF